MPTHRAFASPGLSSIRHNVNITIVREDNDKLRVVTSYILNDGRLEQDEGKKKKIEIQATKRVTNLRQGILLYKKKKL